MSDVATLIPAKILAVHLGRDAYVYVRQSTLTQVREHTESLARQYELRERAVALGWDAHQVKVIDADLGRSGAESIRSVMAWPLASVYSPKRICCGPASMPASARARL